MVKRAILACLLAALGSVPCLAQGVIGTNSFSGLDSQDNPSALQPNQSQDLLNVRIQPGGRSVYKREGYGLFQSLNSVSTATVHGGYHFQQTGGSDVQLWGSDTGLYASVSDASFVKVATGTVGATWQCTDNLGFAYCVTSANDTPVKTDGSLANTSYQPSIPAGSIITSTPLQLVVGGVSGNASSIYVSANNNFTNFTAAPLPTDPYVEIINAPGSRLTHLGYYFGNIYWWKDQSMGYISGSASQSTIGITIISNQIGTLDNSSAFWNPTTYDQGNKFNSGTQTTTSGNPYFNEMSSLGGIFFRGQDNHVYQYDGYTLTRLSRIITPNITSSSRKKANSWTQTSQSDFQAGLGVPSGNINTTINPGAVTVQSFSQTDDFAGGVFSNTQLLSGAVVISTDSNNITNPSFEGTCNSSGCSGWDFSQGGIIGVLSADSQSCGTFTPQGGSQFMSDVLGQSNAVVSFIDGVSSAPLASVTTNSGSTTCAWTQATVPMAGVGRHYGRIKIHHGNDWYSDFFVANGNDITFYYASGFSAGGSTWRVLYDSFDDNPKTTVTSGSFTSKAFDTGFTSATIELQALYTANASTPAFTVQTSTSATGIFSTLMVSSGTNAVGNEFVRYRADFTASLANNALSSLTSATIVARSTGSYYSSVHNSPSLTSWDAMVISDSQIGNSSISYFTRASTNSFTILSATPSWNAQGKNAAVVATTGTYIQLRADFSVTAATDVPTLNDFTFNWFEGSASDKAYIQYFQDAIWFSVSSSSSVSTNNTIFYLDLLNNTWLKDNIASNGFLVENNKLYIGSPLSASIYKFGGVLTDNSNPIHSYWKSMDFTGQDPMVQNSWEQADFSFAESSNTVTFTYDVDQSTSTFLKTVQIPLYSTKNSIVKRGLSLSPGTIGTYYNFKIEDNSSLPAWTLMGQRTLYDPLPWRPQLSN